MNERTLFEGLQAFDPCRQKAPQAAPHDHRHLVSAVERQELHLRAAGRESVDTSRKIIKLPDNTCLPYFELFFISYLKFK